MVVKAFARRACRLAARKVYCEEVSRVQDCSSHFASIDFKIMCGIGHEPNTIAAIRRLVRPGMTAIDVGANIGWMTLHMAAGVGPTGHVIALEASDWTYERLKKNVALNSFNWIKTIRAAVGASDKDSIEIQLPRGYRLDGSATEVIQRPPLVKLDTVVTGKVDFIKSDTDGCETDVFQGATGILENCRPILLFEVAPFYSGGAGLEKTFADLDRLGYRFEDLAGRPINPLTEMKKVREPNSIEVVAQI